MPLQEHTFVIKLIHPFFKNYKKEITKTPKIYSLDLGLRNFIINNFNDVDLRNDVGELSGNFFFLKLLNKNAYGFNKINFWHTTNQTEIDFIITEPEQVKAVEVKYQRTSLPKSFQTIRRYFRSFHKMTLYSSRLRIKHLSDSDLQSHGIRIFNSDR